MKIETRAITSARFPSFPKNLPKSTAAAPARRALPFAGAPQLAIRRGRGWSEILSARAIARRYRSDSAIERWRISADSQELRNCIIIMISQSSYFDFVKLLANHGLFLTVLAASDDQIERQRHMEYASRFLVYTYIPYDRKHDLEDFIDDGIIQLAEGGVKREQAQRFKSTFDLLGTMFGSNALRRIDGDRPRGRVSLAAFECIAVGIGKNIDAIAARQDLSGPAISTPWWSTRSIASPARSPIFSSDEV